MLANTSPHPIGLNIERANGVYLFDADGKSYLDFTAGVAVNNLGHNVAEIKTAIIDQLQKHTHVMVYGEFNQPIVTAFQKSLINLLPNSLNTVYPVNSGTEAIEGALKIAKKHTQRSKIISFTGAYHGSTHGSMSVSANELKKSAFRPLLPAVEFIEWNNINTLNSINNEVSCVIIETIQGDAGVRIPTQEFMTALRERCNETGSLLILDEIQCGFGRTGTFSAFEQYGIIPDILCLGKALGGGLPIGVIVSNKKILDSIQANPKLGHITTFGGNPIICAASNAALKKYTTIQDKLHVEQKGLLIEQLIQHPSIKKIRRIGLLIGIELESSKKVSELIERTREKGLLIFWFLSVPNGFRVSPPLTISREEIVKGCKIITETLDELK